MRYSNLSFHDGYRTCLYNQVFEKIKLMFRQQKNLKRSFYSITLGEEKAYGQIHVGKARPRPVMTVVVGDVRVRQ